MSNPTVRDRVEEEIDGRIHGLSVTARRGSTSYVVVSHTTSGNRGDRLCLTTVVVDLDDGTVKPSGNSMWVPGDSGAVTALTRGVARAANDHRDGDVDAPPVEVGDGAEDLLDTEVEPDDYDGGDDGGLSPAKGEPPEAVHGLDERLREAGVDTVERYIRLEFGDKSPWSHTRGDTEYLVENYGVYATSEDALVFVDVDDPENLDTPLPETYRVSSPHGDVERSHYYYVVDDPEAYREGLGKWNAAPSWGDVRTANQYVVGPGSQLDGCEKGDACDGRCHEPDGGVYEVVDDREIAEVSAEWLLDLLREDGDVEVSPEPDDGGAAPVVADGGDSSEEEISDEPEDVDDVECHDCGEEIPETEASVLASDGERTVYACRGGCE